MGAITCGWNGIVPIHRVIAGDAKTNEELKKKLLAPAHWQTDPEKTLALLRDVPVATIQKMVTASHRGIAPLGRQKEAHGDIVQVKARSPFRVPRHITPNPTEV